MHKYEYRCAVPKCSFLFEELARMDGDNPDCPRCNGPTMKLKMMMNGLHSSFPRFWTSVQSMVFCQLQEIR